MFAGWTCEGNNCYSGSNQNATITMNNNVSETATFKLKPNVYYLNVIANASGAGNLTGSGMYMNGTVVNISETPQQGYVFQGWDTLATSRGGYAGSGKSCGSSGSYCVSITIYGNVTEIADYQSAPSVQYSFTTTLPTTTIPVSAYSFNSPVPSGALSVGQTIDNQGDNFTLVGVALPNGIPEANITVFCYHAPLPSYISQPGYQWYRGYVGDFWINPDQTYNLSVGNACDNEAIRVSHVNWSPYTDDQWAIVQID